VLGEVGKLPEVYAELEVNFFLLRRLLGVRTQGNEKAGKVQKLAKAEVLMLNIGSMSTGARVLAVKADMAKLQLTSPVRMPPHHHPVTYAYDSQQRSQGAEPAIIRTKPYREPPPARPAGTAFYASSRRQRFFATSNPIASKPAVVCSLQEFGKSLLRWL
jgi:hypothetical protein